MLTQRVYRIFLRYADNALALETQGGVLHDSTGAAIGRVDAFELQQNRLHVRGQARATRIGVQYGSRQHWVLPAADGAFHLDLPFEAGPVGVLTDVGGHETLKTFEGFSERRVKRARLALSAPFMASVIQLAPQIWRWKRNGDMGAREVVKETLGVVPRSHAAVLEPDVLVAPLPAPCPFDAVTLVLPVYNAFDLLREALDRIERHTDIDWRLVLVEDASPEVGLRDWLRDWAEDPQRCDRVTLLCNEANLGFIGSVNRGFEVAQSWPGDPVVLVNSDALVPAGWASRLLAPLADASVASVTPLSNDAEIFTVPVLCHRHTLEPGQGDALDRAAATLGVAAGQDAPTGVGFCMALAPQFLADVPVFDTAFGRGYGEENDWCQKTRARGGRHVCATNLFVEHRGGASFGSAAKQALLERNIAEINRRYPAYEDEVQRYVLDDPLTTARLALGLDWAGVVQTGPVPVYLAHAMGGGAEHYLMDRIASDIAAGGVALVVRVGQGHRWKLELHSGFGVTAGLTDDDGLVRALVARLPRRHVVYSCGVGAYDETALPEVLLSFAGQGDRPVPGGAQTIEVLFHDFFPVSPSYTLLGQDGAYHGLPRAGDAGHHARRPDGSTVDLERWQAAWAPLMAAADRVVVFSPSSRDLVAAAYPSAGPIRVEPHALPEAVPEIPRAPRKSGVPVIGVLGNIGPQKGAGLLQEFSRDLARRGDAQLVVIGHIAPEYTLSPPSVVHGSYRLSDLPGLVARYGIDVWLIPSIWPETFSFTTHEALATGMPVFCFDLGAQADAVHAARAGGASGGVLPLMDAGSMDRMTLVAAVNDELARLETNIREFEHV